MRIRTLLVLLIILLIANTFSQNRNVSQITHLTKSGIIVQDPDSLLLDYYNYFELTNLYAASKSQLENKIAETLEQRYEDGQWVFGGSSYVLYDEKGNRAEFLIHFESSITMSTWYVKYLYDEDDNLVETTQYGWDENGLRTEDIKHFTTYNAAGNVIEQLQTRYIGGAWQNVMRWTFTYDSDNNKTREITEYYDGSAWLPQERITYTYENSNLVQSLTEMYYPPTEEWWQMNRGIYTNDEYGRTITYIRQYYDSSLEEWTDNNKEEYSYDNEGNESQIIYFTYDSYNKTWMPDFKTENVFEYGIIISSIQYWYINDEWTYHSKSQTSVHELPVLQVVLNLNENRIFPGTSLYLDWFSHKIESVNVDFSSDNGITWNSIAANQPADSQVLWNVPDNELSNSYLRVSDASDQNIYSQNVYPIKIARASYEYLTHNTQKVEFSALNDGHIGINQDYFLGSGFVFNNYPNALFGGGILIGSESLGAATGMVPSLNIEETENVSPLYDFTSNETFNQISECQLKSTGYDPDLEMLITQRTLSRGGDSFVFVLYEVYNSLDKDIEGLYLGLNADWDVGNYSNNAGGYDKEKGLVYQYEPNSSSDPNYYGLLSLNNFANCNVARSEDVFGEVHEDLFKLMTEDVVSQGENQLGDYRSYIGSGPFNLAIGETIDAGFAILAGESLEELKANADIAMSLWNSGVVGINENNPVELSFKLANNYPNPFNPSTKISYIIPEQTHVSIKVYDLLGREVSTLVNRIQNAGNYEVTFDASDSDKQISSGVYLYTLKAGRFMQSRKMMIIK